MKTDKFKKGILSILNDDVRIAPVLSPTPYLWSRSSEKNDGERLFKKLWSDGDYDGAYALISDDKWMKRNRTIALMWNAAVLIHGDYLSRGLVQTASAKPDKKRARAILENLVSTYGEGDLEEMDGNILENARRFLKEFDDVSFLTFLSGTCVLRLMAAENGDMKVNQGRCLEPFQKFAVMDEGFDLFIRPAADPHGFGALSSLYSCDGQGNEDENIFNHIEFARNEAGAWMAYMLSVAPTLLRCFWHGGYERRKYILSRYDLASLFDGKGITLDCKDAAGIIHPEVTFKRKTAYVECCYWNDWRGLVKERTSVKFDGNRVVEVKNLRDKTLYRYNCMVRF